MAPQIHADQLRLIARREARAGPARTCLPTTAGCLSDRSVGPEGRRRQNDHDSHLGRDAGAGARRPGPGARRRSGLWESRRARGPFVILVHRQPARRHQPVALQRRARAHQRERGQSRDTPGGRVHRGAAWAQREGSAFRGQHRLEVLQPRIGGLRGRPFRPGDPRRPRNLVRDSDRHQRVDRQRPASPDGAGLVAQQRFSGSAEPCVCGDQPRRTGRNQRRGETAGAAVPAASSHPAELCCCPGTNTSRTDPKFGSTCSTPVYQRRVLELAAALSDDFERAGRR